MTSPLKRLYYIKSSLRMHIYNKNTLFYWVKCTSLFIAIEERDSERTERIVTNRSIQNKQQRGFLFGRNAKNPLKHWGFLKSKRTTSRWLSLFALQKWRRGRDSNPRTREGQRFSRPPRSTTPPPLLNFAGTLYHIVPAEILSMLTM